MEEGGSAMHCIHQGKGDAILFIHGMPTNRMLWNETIQQLSSHHRCFAVDLPGMGETPFIPYGPDYLDRLAKQIELLRIQHGVKKWHVVGHDAGSAIAVQYAARFSQHVACLALMSPAIFPELKPFYLLNPLRKPLVGEVLAPLVHLLFWQIAMRRAVAGESNGKLRRAFSEPFSGLTGAWRLMRLVRWGRPEDMLGEIPARLAALPMPTLLFHGIRDVLPATFAERAALLIPHSRIVTLDAGHFIPLDRPNDVAACLRSFFAENHTTMELPIRTTKLRKHSDHARLVVAKPLSIDTHGGQTKPSFASHSLSGLEHLPA
jgi:pimeloyl-ACP methyl ester carboxylesterase